MLAIALTCGGGGTGSESKNDGIGESAGRRLAGHFHVQAVIDEADRVHRAPVGSDEALEAQLVAQNGGQRVLLPQAKGPLMWLYEHITDETPASLMAASNGAT